MRSKIIIERDGKLFNVKLKTVKTKRVYKKCNSLQLTAHFTRFMYKGSRMKLWTHEADLGTTTSGNAVVSSFVFKAVPASFEKGIEECEQGKHVDLDKALTETPPKCKSKKS